MGSGRRILLCLFCFLCVVFLAQAWNLDRSDFEAFRQLKKGLGISDQRHPCKFVGIQCSGGRITGIVLKSRRLTGFISPAIGRLSMLKELSLQNNHLSSRIPLQISGCQNLEILNLHGNKFFGEIPPGISSLVSLRSLDLSSNGFSGDLSFLKHFPNLEILSLSDNFFTGKIPPAVRSFRNLRFANFTGNLLDYLPELPAADVEYSQRSSFPRRYRLAEKSTASPPTSSPTARSSAQSSGSPAPAPSPAASHEKKKKKKEKRVASWILGFLGGSVAGILSGVIFSIIFRILMNCIRGRPKKDEGVTIFTPLIIKKVEDLDFLKNDEGLACLELIGRGGCGEVYKVELPGSEGKLLAIKKIINNSNDGDTENLNEEDSKLIINKRMKQIRSEIQTVGHIRHRNLLPLIAHVARPDCHYLVYEFMKNGSLQDALDQVRQGNRELDWPTRHRIASGIAAGLEYLHHLHNPKIIHRDLKPANILLDDDLESRIADFGLAKAIPEVNTHMTSSNVVGTLGFIAPEYHQTLKFTDKCDIYSFGVLLAVLVMGKWPSDEFFQQTEEMRMMKWLANVIASEEPKAAIDPQLMGYGFEEEMLLVLKIACFCTVDDPKQRPNSKDVRCMLAQVKKLL